MGAGIYLDNISLIRRNSRAEEQQQKDRVILDSVSFQVEPEEITAILGPSGSGKSTLLRLLNRLEDPSSGRIIIDGRDVREIPVLELRRRVALVAQVPVTFCDTVLQELTYGPSIAGIDPDESARSARELFGEFNMDPEILERNPRRLSVGEKQRICVMRALMNRPDVLLLDEPTSALDERSVHRLLGIIENINRLHGTTVVLVTHIISHGRAVARSAVGLAEGKVISAGTMEEVIEALRIHGIDDDPEDPGNLRLTSGEIEEA